MRKLRLNTTISQKHWELLDKNVQKHGTQSRVLEAALEALKSELESNEARLPPEKQLLMRVMMEFGGCVCFLHKDLFLELVRTMDFERVTEIVTKLKLPELNVAFYYQKPIKECSLKEVVDGAVIACKVGNWLQSISCADKGEYYLIEATHGGGCLKCSKLFNLYFENLFNAYGAKTQCTLSEYGLFVKVFKK